MNIELETVEIGGMPFIKIPESEQAKLNIAMRWIQLNNRADERNKVVSLIMVAIQYGKKQVSIPFIISDQPTKSALLKHGFVYSWLSGTITWE